MFLTFEIMSGPDASIFIGFWILNISFEYRSYLHWGGGAMPPQIVRTFVGILTLYDKLALFRVFKIDIVSEVKSLKLLKSSEFLNRQQGPGVIQTGRGRIINVSSNINNIRCLRILG